MCCIVIFAELQSLQMVLKSVVLFLCGHSLAAVVWNKLFFLLKWLEMVLKSVIVLFLCGHSLDGVVWNKFFFFYLNGFNIA